MNASLSYAICNESKAPELSPAVIERVRSDSQAAYDGIFAPAWNSLPVDIVIGSDSSSARLLHLVDLIPEAPDALAYHTVDEQGRPVLRLGVETIRSNLAPGENLVDEISKAMTHEIFETAVNPFVADYTFIAGKAAMLSKEVCDPVQGGSFTVGETEISNFVLPSYFDAEDSDGPFDHNGELTEPLSCSPGGYQAWSDGSQTFGESIAAHKHAQAERYSRATARHRQAA